MSKPTSTFYIPSSKHALRVAIVHDWLVGGGAELVVEQLHKMYPGAPIYTSYATDEWRKRLDNKVITGWLQHFGRLRKFLVLGRIWWFTRLDLSSYDLVISSCGNGEAKAIKLGKSKVEGRSWLNKLKAIFHLPNSNFQNSRKPLHINYCHTPVHYYWRHYDRYLAEPGFGVFNPLARLGLRLLVGPLRRWDKNTASQRPDVYIANSSHTASEVMQFYGRESSVVNPPIYTERFKNVQQPERRLGFVTAQRQVPYKRIDLIIEACNQLGVNLLVVGRGPEHENLKKIAGPTIYFRIDITDKQMPAIMASPKAFLFAAYEDFGITPLEAMAAGTPVIAYKKGGALDYVMPGKTGEFFEEQTVQSIVSALQNFDESKYNDKTIANFADNFSAEKFRTNMQNAIDSALEKSKKASEDGEATATKPDLYN